VIGNRTSFKNDSCITYTPISAIRCTEDNRPHGAISHTL
jgi:hypothetical protein